LNGQKGGPPKRNGTKAPVPFALVEIRGQIWTKIRRSSDMRANQEIFKQKMLQFLSIWIYIEGRNVFPIFEPIFVFLPVSLLLLLFDRNQHQFFFALWIKMDLSFEFLFAFSSMLSPHRFQYYLTLVQLKMLNNYDAFAMPSCVQHHCLAQSYSSFAPPSPFFSS